MAEKTRTGKRQKSNTDMVREAAQALRSTGTEDPKDDDLIDQLRAWGHHPDLKAARRAKYHLWDSANRLSKTDVSTWPAYWREQDRQARNATVEGLIEDLAARYSTPEANEVLSAYPDIFRGFAGSLLGPLTFPGTGPFRATDVETIFDPEDFYRISSDRFQQFHDSIRANLDKSLALEMDDYRRRIGERGLGENRLRPFLKKLDQLTHDQLLANRDPDGRPLHLIFGPTDWHNLELFNNRMLDDDQFRTQAIRRGWVRDAALENEGSVPSYLCVHLIVTGPDYLVLTHRLARVRFYPRTYTVSLEENMAGPHTETSREIWREGDQDIHACARRGLIEELGLRSSNVSPNDLLLLGLFPEAPLAGVVAVVWARLALSWNVFVSRIRDARDPEARVIAREPLDTANLVKLFLQDTYTPIKDPERGSDYYVPISTKVETGPFHPSARSRILAYLLADKRRHPTKTVIEEFRKQIDS